MVDCGFSRFRSHCLEPAARFSPPKSRRSRTPGLGQKPPIEEDLTFPMPRTAGLIDEYVVYIGFDPQGFREPPKKRPERAPPKRRPPA